MSRPRYGLARVLSKRGLCSRSEAERLIRDGRVRLDGRLIRDPEHPADLQRAIRKVMMSDQLEPKDGPAMTATEVHVLETA